MASYMVKVTLGRGLLPCQAPVCDISTNKRYQAPGSKPIAACSYQHAETAFEAQAGRRLLASVAA